MGYGRSMLVGAVAGLLVVVLAVVAVVYVVPSMRSSIAQPGDRILLVVGSRSGLDAGQVAQLIAVADLSGDGLSITLVDPMLKVAVADTTYDRLRDAYPFGGGAGVSRAYASATGGAPLPVVSVGQAGLEALVDEAGGVEATIPAAANVFDGTRMFTFTPGPRHLSGADVVALLSSQDYLETPEDRAALASTVAAGLAKALSAPRLDLTGAVAGGRVTSSLSAEDLTAVGRRLRDSSGRTRVVSFSR